MSVAYMLTIITNESVEQSELGLRCLTKIHLNHFNNEPRHLISNNVAYLLE